MQGGKSRTKGVKPQIKGCNPPARGGIPQWKVPLPAGFPLRTRRSGLEPRSRLPSCFPPDLGIIFLLATVGTRQTPESPSQARRLAWNRDPRDQRRRLPGAGLERRGGMSPLLLGPDRSLGITWGNFGMIGAGGSLG